jgi:3-hydroxybutyryl-CoA dehydrogenase
LNWSIWSGSTPACGLGTRLHILAYLHKSFGEKKVRPCPLLAQYVKAGRLGR